jgi:hypothetical protein
MMDGLCLNPILGFAVRMFIYEFYLKKKTPTLLDKNCTFPFGLFPGVWSLNANVSEHSVCSILIQESVGSVTVVEKFVVSEKFRSVA